MPERKEKSANDTSDREIVISRLLDAPPELVFRAFTDPTQVGFWWGPNGFTITIHEMDVRPGGVWRFIMHGPDGTDYDNYIKYIEIEKPNRLVYTIGCNETDADPAIATVTFDRQGPKTLLTLRLLFKTREERDETAKYAVEGGNQTVARLAAHLPKMK